MYVQCFHAVSLPSIKFQSGKIEGRWLCEGFSFKSRFQLDVVTLLLLELGKKGLVVVPKMSLRPALTASLSHLNPLL